jgi:GntR family transcriptional repressor for pyruvate dehydrogenase complex
MRVLAGDIASGRLPAGAALPREADLARQFRVSRGVARECLRGLEERRLVVVRHGRGATVMPEREWDVFDAEVLTAILGSGRGPGVLGEYEECLRVLETEAAGLAAERAGESDLARLSDTLAQMAAAAERPASGVAAAMLYDRADAEFHDALLAAARNRALASVADPIRRALASARAPHRRLARSPEGHRRVLAAIAAGDAVAARVAMREHLSEPDVIVTADHIRGMR